MGGVLQQVRVGGGTAELLVVVVLLVVQPIDWCMVVWD
jgi:hypothetical protein